MLELFKNDAQAQARLRAPLFEEKVIDFILEMAQVKEKRLPPEELVKAATAA